MTRESGTSAYVAKCLAEGKTIKVIRRIINLYLARQIYRAVNAAGRLAATAS